MKVLLKYNFGKEEIIFIVSRLARHEISLINTSAWANVLCRLHSAITNWSGQDDKVEQSDFKEMSKSGSESLEPAVTPNRHDDPTGLLSVRDENELDFGCGDESSRLARKRHGETLDSQREAQEPDVSETITPRRPEGDS